MQARNPAWRARFALVTGLLVLAIGAFDYLTGTHFSFLVFYLVPIAVVGWRAGRWPALAVAAVASVTWLAAEAAAAPRIDVPLLLWNFLNRTSVFLVTAFFSDLLSHQINLAYTDYLTGLPNRRALLHRLRAAAFRRGQERVSLCVAYLDLDNFKQVNDRFGHAVGDAVLQRIADTIRVTIRASDLPARVGGDEFVVVFWRLPSEHALRIAHRLTRRIAELGEEYEGAGLGASIGLASFEERPDRPESMLAEADRALQEAKAAGKSQVVWRPATVPEVETESSSSSRV
jgi:diguanylate cyclase (GGDEF)-like protein